MGEFDKYANCDEQRGARRGMTRQRVCYIMMSIQLLKESQGGGFGRVGVLINRKILIEFNCVADVDNSVKPEEHNVIEAWRRII